MQSSTAILLFSRSAVAEARHKGFGNDTAAAQRITTALLRRTRATIARAGLPVYELDETEQLDGTFGERISGAINDVFARGHSHLIVVGNDCPQLRAAHLRAAARHLEAGRPVLGPDGRGGAWLIGLARDQFCATTLSRLAWQTDLLFGQLESHLAGVAYLPRLRDINRLDDLRHCWNRLADFGDGLFQLLFGRDAVAAQHRRLQNRPTLLRPVGRAPPARVA